MCARIMRRWMGQLPHRFCLTKFSSNRPFIQNYYCALQTREVHNHNRHVFALHYQELKELISGSEPDEVIGITDMALLKRMTSILRFKSGDQFVLFDLHSTFQLFQVVHVDKRMITAKKLPKDKDEELTTLLNQRKKFTISASICMTKTKETFEEMIYQCSSMGVNHIIPIITEEKKQQQHAEYFENKKERLNNIMISAIEQSKQFYGTPSIESPISLPDYVSKLSNNNDNMERRIFLDVDGDLSWMNLLREIEHHKEQPSTMSINVLVGPERDLFDHERQHLKQMGFVPTSLSKKIVYKSETAFTVAMGSIMSVIWNK
ncbi:hypothetical protein C9374_003055 [Naegleria lovaniensis]|uniref:16S rRNA (uracil(1498)-N(3))-methyltransferase n=1 Tax=Naegleria lovaniensis TaxID=51637 RepID=A0AA88GPG1_NAELO|nr:uncharacterized protein C9374_003055 [Naegleria lovaniensis]KAG2385906.1 hypothetical protein C9374_003055 [Naegleria lovaniensis]